MTEWHEILLGDAMTVHHGFAFKGEYFSDEGRLVVLTPGNFFDSGGFKPKSGKEKYYEGPLPDGFLLSRGDVVIAMTEQAQGLLGSSATIPCDGVYLHNQRIGLVEVLDCAVLNARYVYHLMNTPLVRNQLQASATGTKVRHTAPARIEAVRVSAPCVRVQMVIAEVLDAVDDLIENNRRRIELLEQMAQAIYQEWFVHFRYPGHEDGAFVDSSVGVIPMGWELTTASDALEVNPRVKIDKLSEYPFLTMGDLSETSMVCFPSATKPGNSGAKFQNGDTLFARITPCLENGKTGLVQCLANGQVGRGSTEFVVLRGRKVGAAFTYFLARSEEFRGHAIQSMSGASGRQRVRNECFDSYVLPLGPTSLLAHFEDVAAPALRMAHALALESIRLSAIRDLLLPKLVTGQTDVSKLDLDAVVGSVA